MFFKNFLFSVVVVSLFFAGCEAILAVAGVQPVLDTEDPFVGFAGNIPLFEEGKAADDSAVIRTAENKRLLFNYQEFPQQKGAGTYRVFCVGGSTTFGRPYDDPVSFCGWLRAYLEAADPARKWEIINAGGVSYASYRVTRLMQELAQYQPDLFIVYSGQNEFLEQRSYGALAELPDWLLSLNATLSGTRIYTAMSRAIDAIKPGSLAQAREQYRLSGEVDTVLDHTVGPESYHRDDALKQQIISHYRLNLERMVRIARQAGAAVIMVKPAINIRDLSPFKSEHGPGLGDAAREEWEALYERAQALERSGDHEQALAAYRAALELDDRYADLHYRIGKVLFGLGEYDAAERSLQRAVEEDIAPLRILAPMQASVAEVAAEAGVPLVDFPALLRAAYREQYDHAVFGSEYFVDHVHANMEGYRLLGLALFDELVRLDIARPAVAMSAAQREAIRQQVIGQQDIEDEGHALVKLARVFAWAGKFAEAYPLFRQGLEKLGPRPELYDQMARAAYVLGDEDAAIGHLREMLERFPGARNGHAKLAAIYANRGETDIAITHCRLELLQAPGNIDVTEMLGELYERQGNDAEARRKYERVLQRAPGQTSAAIRLAFLLIRTGQHDTALQVVRQVLQDNPDHYQAHNALGLILTEQGDLETAVHHFTEALRLHPGDVAITSNLQQLRAVQQQDRDMTVFIPREVCSRLPSYVDRCPSENL